MASARLRPTWSPAHAGAYRRPGGPWDVPDLHRAFAASPRPGTAVVDGDVRLAGPALDALAAGLAGGLARAGVGRLDRVAWQLPNWHEAVALFHACWRLGAVAVPLPHRLGRREVTAALDAVAPAALFAAPGVALADEPACIVVRGEGRFADLAASDALPPAAVRPSDIAVVVFTSGSTGVPKAVLHTHRALVYKASAQARVHALGVGDVVLVPAPLGHVSGLLNGVLLPAAAGLTTVLMDAWDPSAAIGLVEREKVTYMGGPSTFLTSMVAAPDFAGGRVASLRVASMGGSAMTPSAIRDLGAALGCTVKRTYGSSEAPTITTLHAGDPASRGADTDGRAVGAAQVAVADPVACRRLPAGEVGEVWVRGPELFAGYAGAAQTAAAVHRGWFRTGDLGRLDPEGWLTIVGRLKELVIRGGENVPTAEVEAALEAHPAVREAVVVGVPDPVLGERVGAAVVADPGFDVEACRRWFEERGMARFKTPEVVVRVAAVPLTHVGKPDRAVIGRLVAEGAPWT